MAVNGPKIIYGGGSLWTTSVEDTENVLKVLEELGITNIDTAESYGNSEENLGQTRAASRGFVLDTKVSTAIGPEPTTKDVVLRHAKESLRRLNTKTVDVYYLHAPDRRVPLEDTLAAVDELFKQGAFKRFGLSNFLPHEVEQVVDICKEKNFVRPSVFQGNYSPVARRADNELFPVLRKHNIAFYAYSPVAGGFLTKTREILTSQNATGRWDPNSDIGKLYGGLYNKPSYLDALDAWGQIAEDENISKAELAYRWTAFSSELRGELGDGIIFGSFKQDHLRETVGWIRKGPISANAAKKVDEMWDLIRNESVWDNFNDFLEKQRGDSKN